MNSATPRRLLFLACGLCFALVITLGLGNKAAAATCGSGGTNCPYFKSFGADIFAGGWFAGPNCSTNYQSYNAGASPNDKNGGILTYARENASGNATGGASSQYGAFALGSIENLDASSYGFYSGAAPNGASTGGNVDQLTFANTPRPSSSWGGQFEGTGTAHCIADYFGTKKGNNPPGFVGATLSDVNNLPSSQNTFKSVTPGMFTIDGGNIDAGKSIGLFVLGNVYIGGNITYKTHKATTVPKFALVVQGNIYIGPGVSRLDGWYIAQPTSGTSDGVIWTCQDNQNNVQNISNTFLTGSCNNQLTVNGALTAKQINFTRVKGDVSVPAATAGEPDSSNNIAEVINYTPDMVIGGPFFNAGSSYNLDSLVSLPPVF